MTASEMAELDRRIAVMQAYRDGKSVQFRYTSNNVGTSGSWQHIHPAGLPDWNWAVSDYRIAPEPRKPRSWHAWVDGRNKLHSSQPDEGHPELITVTEVYPDHLPGSDIGKPVEVTIVYKLGQWVVSTVRNRQCPAVSGESIELREVLHSHYRIAPEPRKPRECYAVFTSDCYVRTIGAKAYSAALTVRVGGDDEVVHMREVLPD